MINYPYAIRIGLIWGAAYILIQLILYLFSSSLITNSWIASLIFLLGLIPMYISGSEHKLKLGGYLSWKEALIPIWITSIVYSFFSMVFTFILYNFLAPELIDEQRNAQIKIMENFRGTMGNEATEKAIEDIANTNPFSFGKIILAFCFSLIFYFIISSIIALIIKKENPNMIFEKYKNNSDPFDATNS